MKKIFFSVFFFLICLFSKAQADSCNLRISLLTCTPGEELYSSFGHSALRVVDRANNFDIVFNYGTFDFDDPDFYTKFVRGKLLYFVSVTTFSDFMSQYEYEGRGVTEQILNLSCDEKQNLLAALNENAKEENKYYKYDFKKEKFVAGVDRAEGWMNNVFARMPQSLLRLAGETLYPHLS